MAHDLSRWQGRTAIVTGASSGIGRAVAVALAEAGLKVVLVGRNRVRLRAVAQEIRLGGGIAWAQAADLTRPEKVRALFAAVRAKRGGVDVLVNAAAVRGGNSLLSPDWDELQEALDLNVRGALLCMREAVDAMRGKPDSAIINLSSMVGHRVLPGVPALYAATKHALRVLTDGLRAELAGQKPPIRIAMISPGLTDTPWHEKPHGLVAEHGSYPFAPLRPSDIVDAVCYILSTRPGVQISDILMRASAQPF